MQKNKDTSIYRFLEAQQGKTRYPSFDVALNELKMGKKFTHWIWYIFPQIRGLSSGDNATYYSIVNLTEAMEYLNNKTLLCNYIITLNEVNNCLKKGYILDQIFNPLDTKKVISSITLFYIAAKSILKKKVNFPPNKCLFLLMALIKKIINKEKRTFDILTFKKLNVK